MHFYILLDKRRYLIYYILLLLVFSGCTENNSFDDEISYMEIENQELKLQIEALKEMISTYADGTETRVDINNSTFPLVVEETTYYGYANIEGEIELYKNADVMSSSIMISGTVQVISEVESNATNWLLVKCFSKDVFGYVNPADIIETDRKGSYMNISSESINGVHLGENISKAIETFGNDFLLVDSPEYVFSNYIRYNSESEDFINIEYDPVTNIILKIISARSDTLLGGTMIGIGDNIDSITDKLGTIYEFNKENDHIIFKLENSNNQRRST